MLPSAPRTDTLAGICECHVHVLDPQRFPYAAGRTYTPAPATSPSSPPATGCGMPFAQIATRIGGGITVTVVLAVAAIWGL